MTEFKFTGDEDCFMFNCLTHFPLKQCFESILWDDEVELDNDIHWILVGNKLIVPEGYMRIRAGSAGTGSGTSVGYVFEYTLLHEFNEDVVSIIKSKVEYLKTLKYNKRKSGYLKSALYGLAVNRTEDDIEYIKEFE